MRVAILHSKSDERLNEALQRCGMTAYFFHEKEDLLSLRDFQGYILLGQQQGDDNTKNHLYEILFKQSEMGKPILGMGMGCQMLTEWGFIPGLERNQSAIAVVAAERDFSSPITLTKNFQRNAFTEKLPLGLSLQLEFSQALVFNIPPALSLEMEMQGQIIFASMDNKPAAISNKAGNVMAIIPELHTSLASDPIFLSMYAYIMSGMHEKTYPLYYQPR